MVNSPPHWRNVDCCRRGSVRASRGFTLPELLVVLGLVALLLSQLPPDLSAATRHNQLYATALTFSQQLQLARNSAIQRNSRITLCKSDNPTQCNSDANWEDGWILFENLDGDGRIDPDDTILQRHHPLPTGITLRGVGNFKNRVTYRPTGDSTSFGRLVLCEQGQLDGSQALYISSTGRIRIAADSSGDNIPEDGNGNNISSCEL
jgi:type IV fimbrial biogenesis protein FimT